MSIIASIIIAGSTVFVNTPEEALNYKPAVDTLELRIGPISGQAYTNEPTIVTNEPYKTILEMKSRIDIMWTDYTNRLEEVKKHKAAIMKRKSAVERVRENAKKRKSAMGKSAGGVKK